METAAEGAFGGGGDLADRSPQGAAEDDAGGDRDGGMAGAEPGQDHQHRADGGGAEQPGDQSG